MTNPEIDGDGTKRWYNEQRQLHREDGPAIECKTEVNKRHREDGSAVLYPDGTEYWLRHGKYHRVDGPAFISRTGREDWYVNDEKIDIKPILERLDISPDWKSWTDEEKFLVRLALS